MTASVLASTSSCTIAPRPFLRAASISPGVPPKAPRLRRCAAVWSFHFCVGNGNSTLIFTPLTFEPWEGRRQIDAAECFCRTKSYTRPATCCALLNSLTDPEAASERNSLLTLNQLVWRSAPVHVRSLQTGQNRARVELFKGRTTGAVRGAVC